MHLDSREVVVYWNNDEGEPVRPEESHENIRHDQTTLTVGGRTVVLPEPDSPNRWREAMDCLTYAELEQLRQDAHAKAMRNLERTLQRRRGRSRRYIAANNLCFLWTLTYAERPADRDQVSADFRAFIKAARRTFGSFPYIAVPERGEESGREHVHLALGSYMPVSGHERIKRRKPLFDSKGRPIVDETGEQVVGGLLELWQHEARGGGNVDVSSKQRAIFAQGGGSAQAMARYLAKEMAGYLNKEAWAGRGEHGYWRSQGYNGRVVTFQHRHPTRPHRTAIGPLLAQVRQVLPGQVVAMWDSDCNEDWRGPPTLWMRVADPTMN